MCLKYWLGLPEVTKEELENEDITRDVEYAKWAKESELDTGELGDQEDINNELLELCRRGTDIVDSSSEG